MSYFVNSSDEAETSFYGAFSNLDMDLMRATWLFSDDIYCIHPGGPLQSGFDKVMSNWAFIFKDSRPPEINYALRRVVRQDNIAIHFVEEQIGSGPEKATVLATNVYINTDQGWRLFSHHASVPPEQSQKVPESAPIH